MSTHPFTRMVASGLLATAIGGGAMTPSQSMPLPVTSVQRLRALLRPSPSVGGATVGGIVVMVGVTAGTAATAGGGADLITVGPSRPVRLPEASWA